MGAVGLNFGSPTSGAGFDVSATVSAIVANLSNIETPWKNQLSTLQSQDAVISNLGTLFSNLSNDLSVLTNFKGILAEKTGSSSNPNILTLTSANNNAVAGTHTVTVSSLAQTSSGYLAPVSNANDALSGSITIQTGTLPAETITLDATNNTLAVLASAINASNAGVVASVLTDSVGSRLSLVSEQSGSGGKISILENSIVEISSSSQNFTQTDDALDGTAYSGVFGSVVSANEPLTGSVSIQTSTGEVQTITLSSSNNTLSGLVAAINNAALGITASVATNSDGLFGISLVSNTLGSGGEFTVTSNVTDSSTGALGYTTAVSGADAKLTVDGVALTSSSNTVNNLIPGITFQLLSPSALQSSGAFEQVQVVIGNDNSDIESTVNQFVVDYNSLTSALNAQDGNSSSGTPQPLFGSPTLSLLQQQLLSGLNISNPNGYLNTVQDASNILTGSISIQVGLNPSTIISLPPDGGTLLDLATSINAANLGVTASIVTNKSGSQLELVSSLIGANGVLVVNSSINNTSTRVNLSYNKSGSDINNLMQLGISVNSNGSLTFDASTLDSVLNSDYSSVVGFFQNINSWGQTFSSILASSGSNSTNGILALAARSNSSIESTLNANISREESLISIQRASLTAELNTANAIMQQLPSQLQGVDELYSAITGYNQNGR